MSNGSTLLEPQTINNAALIAIWEANSVVLSVTSIIKNSRSSAGYLQIALVIRIYKCDLYKKITKFLGQSKPWHNPPDQTAKGHQFVHQRLLRVSADQIYLPTQLKRHL